MMKHDPVTSPAQLQIAMAAFGINSIDGKPLNRHPHAFGIGVLLAVAELAAQDLHDRLDLDTALDGWAATVATLGDKNTEQAIKSWSTLIHQRLNVTAIQLREATTLDGQAFTDFTSLAVEIAADTMSAANSGLDKNRAKDLTTHLRHNIKVLRQAFGDLCTHLRTRGNGGG